MLLLRSQTSQVASVRKYTGKKRGKAVKEGGEDWNVEKSGQEEGAKKES